MLEKYLLMYLCLKLVKNSSDFSNFIYLSAHNLNSCTEPDNNYIFIPSAAWDKDYFYVPGLFALMKKRRSIFTFVSLLFVTDEAEAYQNVRFLSL